MLGSRNRTCRRSKSRCGGAQQAVEFAGWGAAGGRRRSRRSRRGGRRAIIPGGGGGGSRVFPVL